MFICSSVSRFNIFNNSKRSWVLKHICASLCSPTVKSSTTIEANKAYLLKRCKPFLYIQIYSLLRIQSGSITEYRANKLPTVYARQRRFDSPITSVSQVYLLQFYTLVVLRALSNIAMNVLFLLMGNISNVVTVNFASIVNDGNIKVVTKVWPVIWINIFAGINWQVARCGTETMYLLMFFR